MQALNPGVAGQSPRLTPGTGVFRFFCGRIAGDRQWPDRGDRRGVHALEGEVPARGRRP